MTRSIFRKLKVALTSSTIAIMFFSVLFGVVLGIFVHEGIHVMQAYRSDTIRIEGVDFLNFPISFGWRFGWEENITRAMRHQFPKESENWERDAYRIQIIFTFMSMLLAPFCLAIAEEKIRRVRRNGNLREL